MNQQQPAGADKLLRKTRDRFASAVTQAAIREAIQDIPGATLFDGERIILQLAKRLPDFKHCSTFKETRSAMVAWCERQARLVVQFRKLLPSVPCSGHVATILQMRLAEFTGTTEELPTWMIATAEREENALAEFDRWYHTCRQAVRAGIWSVLAGCRDLGVGHGYLLDYGGLSGAAEADDDDDGSGMNDDAALVISGLSESDPVALELETQVWRQVAYEASSIVSGSSPIEVQLRRRGYWSARAWKTARLRERDALREAKWHIGLHGLEREIRGDDGASDFIEVDLAEVLAPGGNLNPIVIRELPWTDADLQRELRKAGPFRVTDPYADCTAEPLPLAA